MLILSREDLVGLLEVREVIEALREVFHAYHEGLTEVPLRIPIQVEPGSDVLYMPALLNEFRGGKVLGEKVVSVFGRNPERGLPLI
ncbi:MAG: ornithine cyclodeaminase, partial [Candidatus Bipolaricaulia bacterium]